MIRLALGIPGPLTAWGFEAFKRLILFSGTQALHVDRMDTVTAAMGLGAAYFSQYPSATLMALAREQPCRAIIFTTTPATAVAYQMQAHGSTLLEAIRSVGASTALIDLDPDAIVLAIHADAMATHEGDGPALLSLLADHLMLPLGEPAAAGILAEIGPPPTHRHPGLSAADEDMINFILETPVANLRDRAVPLKAIWPYRVFFSGDRPNEEAPMVAEATGASRVLYYGPYFHLARGRWRAKLTLGFSKGAVGLPLRLEVHGAGLLGQARLKPRQEGIFAAQFTFEVSAPEHPVELRVQTEEGAIEGRLALGQVELIRV